MSVTHDLHTRRILDRVAESPAVSQRSLSRELGIALGLTNLLLRRFAAKGWIRIIRIRPNRVRYVLTPAGIAHKARLSRDYLVNSIRLYREARDRVQQRLSELLRESGEERARAVVFYGASEVAEVAWICMQRTPFRLVAVVDDERVGKDFFGLVIQPTSALQVDGCNALPYDRVIVMTLDGVEPLGARLRAAGLPAERVFWL